MRVAIEILIRTALFLFGFFDLFGIMWSRGLASSSLELIWWLTPPVALFLGALINRSSGSQSVLFTVALLGTLGCASALSTFYKDWFVAGMSIDVSAWRVVLTLLVAVAFIISAVRVNSARNCDSS